MKCFYCPKTFDLRPYGPRAAMVCFTCAMATTARKKEAEKNFAGQLNAINGIAVVDGGEAGPYPLENNPKALALAKAHGITGEGQG